jgi:hypothetical protein
VYSEVDIRWFQVSISCINFLPFAYRAHINTAPGENLLFLNFKWYSGTILGDASWWFRGWQDLFVGSIQRWCISFGSIYFHCWNWLQGTTNDSQIKIEKLVCWSVGLLVCWFVCRLVGRSVGWSVGRSVGRLVGRSVGRSIGQLVDRLVSWWLVCHSVSYSFGQLVVWSVGWLIGWSVGDWFVTQSVTQSVSCLVGWSVIWLVSQLVVGSLVSHLVVWW